MIAAAMSQRAVRILTVFTLFLLLPPATTVLALDLETVQEAIRLSGARWVAGETSVSHLSDDAKSKLAGLLPEPEIAGASSRELFRAPITAPLPTRLNWSDMDGDNYVSIAKQQGNCGACWAFAAVGALESKVMLRTHQPGLEIDLAEQSLLSCDTTGGCSGGSGWTAASKLRDNGVPLESCLPYQADDTVPCDDRCNEWEQQLRVISKFEQVIGYTGNLTMEEIIATLKSSLASHGPLWTSMQVYDDFYNYRSGVYTYTSGAARGGHAVLLIGFDDASETFTVKNSWGADWGESGTFRIAYNQVANMIEFGAFTYTYGDPVDLVMEPPTASAGEDQTVGEHITVMLNGTGSSDPDGQIDTYAWRQLGNPQVQLTGADTSQPSFTAPNLTTAADAEFLFELTVVDDDGLSATDTVSVTVTWVNDAPTAQAGEDEKVAEGTPVELDGSDSTDTEGEIGTYRWQQDIQADEPRVTLTGADTAQPSFTAPNLTMAADADLVFRLTVTDAHGGADNDWVTITVAWENDPPTANAGEDIAVSEGAAVQLDGSASEDTEGKLSSHQWRRISGPDITLTGADTTTPGFTSPNLTTAEDAALVFELTVTDTAGASDTDQVAITVKWENDAPLAVAGDDQTVAGGDAVTLNAGASSDPDDGIATYTWTQVAGPDVQLSNPHGAQTGFIAPVNSGTDALQLRFELQTTDLGGRSATDSVDIWISPQATPPGEDPQVPPDPTDPADPQEPGDNPPPVDEARDTPEPDVSASGGGGGGCFIAGAAGEYPSR